MADPYNAKITPEQLGTLTGYGAVELETDGRRNVRVTTAAKENKVMSRTATNDDGDEYTVLIFPEKVWESVADIVGFDPEKEKLRTGDMIWMKE